MNGGKATPGPDAQETFGLACPVSPDHLGRLQPASGPMTERESVSRPDPFHRVGVFGLAVLYPGVLWAHQGCRDNGVLGAISQWAWHARPTVGGWGRRSKGLGTRSGGSGGSAWHGRKAPGPGGGGTSGNQMRLGAARDRCHSYRGRLLCTDLSASIWSNISYQAVQALAYQRIVNGTVTLHANNHSRTTQAVETPVSRLPNRLPHLFGHRDRQPERFLRRILMFARSK